MSRAYKLVCGCTVDPKTEHYATMSLGSKRSLPAFRHSTGISLLWLAAAWIVRRIDVGQLKWAYQVHLNRRTCFRPRKVIHVRRRDGKTARLRVPAYRLRCVESLGSSS